VKTYIEKPRTFKGKQLTTANQFSIGEQFAKPWLTFNSVAKGIEIVVSPDKLDPKIIGIMAHVAKDNKMFVAIGDFIIEDRWGAVYPINQKDFEESFEEV